MKIIAKHLTQRFRIKTRLKKDYMRKKSSSSIPRKYFEKIIIQVLRYLLIASEKLETS
jgi:hypothetical protein